MEKECLQRKWVAKKVDRNSFIIVTNSREVVGLGFKEES